MLPPAPSAERAFRAATLLAIAGSLAAVLGAGPVFTQTSDEPSHIAAGMEWLDRGTYTYESLHPPLARVAVALGPYLAGSHSMGVPGIEQEGNAILHARNDYAHRLALARLGALPFFLLAAAVVWAWTRRLAGTGAALVAVLLFVTASPVLAHAGLATTDMAVGGTLAAGLFALALWLESPTWGRTLGLGVAIGLALLSKMSALLFLPACAIAFLLVRGAARRAGGTSIGLVRASAIGRGATALVVAALVIWSGYRWSVGSVAGAVDPLQVGVSWGDGTLGRIAHARVLPASEYLNGLLTLVAKDVQGHKSFLLGDVRSTGWWYFFPVALAVKTPLPLLGLALLGIATLGHGVRRSGWPALLPAAGAGTMLLACLPSHINIGVRHLLPMYPLLAVSAGLGAWWIWKRAGRAGAAVVAALMAAQLVGAVRAHPDYLAYFNVLAGPHPERVLVDSDLDWGQDLGRLADTLRARGVESVALAYAGSADLPKHGLPRFVLLPPDRRATGWIAVSELVLANGWFYDETVPYDGYRWLEAYRPVARIGRSIRLYHLEPRAALSSQQPR